MSKPVLDFDEKTWYAYRDFVVAHTTRYYTGPQGNAYGNLYMQLSLGSVIKLALSVHRGKPLDYARKKTFRKHVSSVLWNFVATRLRETSWEKISRCLGADTELDVPVTPGCLRDFSDLITEIRDSSEDVFALFNALFRWAGVECTMKQLMSRTMVRNGEKW